MPASLPVGTPCCHTSSRLKEQRANVRIRRFVRTSNDKLLAFLKMVRYEVERNFRHFTPPMVYDQRMSAIRHFVEFRDRGIALLQLVLSLDNRQRNRMVFLTSDEQ